MFFWNSLAFLMIQQMLAIWSLVPLPFLNPVWTSGSFWFMFCWNFAWRILSITLLVCEMSVIVQLFEHSLALPFFEIGIKTIWRLLGEIKLGNPDSYEHRFLLVYILKDRILTEEASDNSSNLFERYLLHKIVIRLQWAYVCHRLQFSYVRLFMTP